MAFHCVSQMPPLQAGHCPYTVPAHIVNQMSTPHVALAPSAAEYTGIFHPARGHNPEVSIHQGFSSFNLSVGTGTSSTSSKLVIDRNLHRQAATVPDLCMNSVQPVPEAHTPDSHYQNNSLDFGQHVQNFLVQSQPTDYTQESNPKVKCIKQHSLISSTDGLLSELHQSRNCCEKISAQDISSRVNVLQENPLIEKKKKNTVNIKAKTHKKIRFMKDGCSNACQRRCKQKISEETRNELFTEFWGLESDCERKAFVAHHAVKLPMMTCKEGSKRNASVDWAFMVKGESFSVCKRFFLHTLDASEELAYAAVKESQCSYEGTPIKVKSQVRKQKCSYPGWTETDIDEYCAKKAEFNAQKRDRYERKERIADMKPGCTKTCRRCCQSKFSHEQRLAVFNGYRSLSNVRKQREYLQMHVKRLERKDIKKKNGSRRGCSIQWLLDLKNESIPVCKTFFLHTVGVSEHTAYSIGLQNDLLPVEKTKSVRKPKSPSWISLKNKHIKAMFAKDKACALLTQFGKKVFSIPGETNKKNETNIAKNVSHSNEASSSSILKNRIDALDPLDPCVMDISQRPKSTASSLLSSDCRSETLHAPFHKTVLDQDRGEPIDNQIPISQASYRIFPQCNLDSCRLHSHETSAASQLLARSQRNSPLFLKVNTGNPTNTCNFFFDSQTTVPSSKEKFVSESDIEVNDVMNIKISENNANVNLLLLSRSEPRESIKPQQKINGAIVNTTRPKKYIKRDPRERALGKQMKSGCSDSCRRKCNKRIPHLLREELFREFWQLESDILRREFILPIVNKIPKKSGKRSESRRSCTLQWNIPCNEELVAVCKKFFLDTFDIRDNFVHTVHEKIEHNEGSMEDMRGKHGKKPAAFVQEEKKMENFVKSKATFKAVRCCGCHKDFPRWCLDSKMLIGQLYKEYVDGRKATGGKPACRTSFTSICTKRLNIRHSSAQENTCDMCKNHSISAGQFREISATSLI